MAEGRYDRSKYTWLGKPHPRLRIVGGDPSDPRRASQPPEKPKQISKARQEQALERN
jgi:hypothetical protein